MSAISKTVTIGNGTKNDFQGKRCFQFTEAVINSIAEESLRSTECGSIQVLAGL